MSEDTATADVLLDVPFNDSLSKWDMTLHIRNSHGVQHIGGQTVSEGMKMTKAELVTWHDAQHEKVEGFLAKVESDPERFGIYTIEGGVPVLPDEGRTAMDQAVSEHYWRTSGSGRFVVQYAEYSQSGRRSGGYIQIVCFLPKVSHRHMTAADLATDEEKARAQAVQEAVRENKPIADKPLSAGERKILSDLVNGDFAALKTEMQAFAADALANAKAEINVDWDKKEEKIPDFASEATDLYTEQQDAERDLRRKFEDDLRAMKAKHTAAFEKVFAKAKVKGVLLRAEQDSVYDEASGRNIAKTVYKAEVEGRKDALTQAEKENAAMLNRVLLDLEGQRLAAQRRVLVSGVTPESAKILDAIPSAKDMMVEAQQRKAQQQITS